MVRQVCHHYALVGREQVTQRREDVAGYLELGAMHIAGQPCVSVRQLAPNAAAITYVSNIFSRLLPFSSK